MPSSGNSGRRSWDPRSVVAWLKSSLVHSTSLGHDSGMNGHAELSAFIDEVKDWQLTHGSLIKLVRTEEDHTILARPIGASIFPSPFPRSCFDEAKSLATVYNELYAKIAASEAWLEQALAPLLGTDCLASKLWDIHQQAKQQEGYQPLSLGIFRSDYMLQEASGADGKTQLKQVEFNTFSCAGIAHSSRISQMHKHFCRAGMYDCLVRKIHQDALPMNDNVKHVVTALNHAHVAYGPPKSSICAQTCVLMLVQPGNINIADERPFEYALWDSGVPCRRVVFGAELLGCTSITANGELLYRAQSFGDIAPQEVSLVYLRAGYDDAEYDKIGMACRQRIERSRAIKCPNILGHLATLKIVQAKLAAKGEVERFLLEDKAQSVRRTFAPIYQLDDSEEGLAAQQLAQNPETAVRFVLKPSLEGGGHNIYGQDIPDFLKKLERHQWSEYVLMEMIRPPKVDSVLVYPQGIHDGEVESELGVVGACLWRHTDSGGGEIIENHEAGFTLKTKAKGMNEMSVIKGYGCFDSPCLTDDG